MPNSYAQTQVAFAAVMIAVNSSKTARGTVLANPDKSAQHLSDRGAGVSSGQLLTLIPWFRNAGTARGVSLEPRHQQALHAGWVISDGFQDAATCESSLLR